MNRRELLKAAAALPLAPAVLSNAAFAQSPYPSRNITMIVPFPPGGQADLAARPVAQALERILGKPVIVDNRAGGGGGSVGNAQAARAEPDGYTLLMTLSSLAVLPEADRLFDRPSGLEVSQFAPVARVLADPTLLAVPASAPWKTLKDFVDDAKQRPGQIPYGSSGPYGTLHVAMEMFAASAGIKLLHVPFRGAGPALTALLSGTVQALASAPGTLKQQVDDGKMRVLANWGAERVASFPDLPTFRELGYKDVEFYIWAGLFAQSKSAGPDPDTAARGDGAGGEGARSGQDLRHRRQPGRLSGRAGVFEVRRRRQRAAGRGGEEDRQGGIRSGSSFAAKQGNPEGSLRKTALLRRFAPRDDGFRQTRTGYPLPHFVVISSHAAMAAFPSAFPWQVYALRRHRTSRVNSHAYERTHPNCQRAGSSSPVPLASQR